MTWLNRCRAGTLLLVLSLAGFFGLAPAGWLGIQPAYAVQSTGCLPVTGTYSGVQFSNAISAGIASLISTNSGTTAPVTDCSGATILGQQWFDTSSSQPAWRIWDGTQGLPLAYLDTANHILMPQTGGGIATLASAVTADLCSVHQNYITLTGTTAITSFGSSCAIGQHKIIAFAGALVLTYGSAAIILPTGANVATTAGDSATAIYTGSGVWVITAYTRANGGPLAPVHFPGESLAMRSTTCPAGTLQEDGSAISRTTYAALYAALGTAWGAGDGATTFNLPNSGGFADRGWISGQAADSGRTFGSTQQDQLQDHTHNLTLNLAASGGYNPSYSGSVAPNYTTTYTTTTPVSGNHGSETRMKNITVYRCIVTGLLP